MIYKKTFQFSNFKNWDHEINDSVQIFYDVFLIHPNIILFNSNMTPRIDILANQKKKNICGHHGERLEMTKFAPIDTFNSGDYSLELCLDENVPDNHFVLIFDSNPEGDDGEPIPVDDSDSNDISREAVYIKQSE